MVAAMVVAMMAGMVTIWWLVAVKVAGIAIGMVAGMVA